MSHTRAPLRPAAFVAILVAALALAGCAHVSHAHHDRTVLRDDVRLSGGENVPGDLNVVFSHVVCDDATIDGDVRTYFGDFEQTEACTVRGNVTTAFDGRPALAFAPWLAARDDARAAAEIQQIRVMFAYGVIVLVMFLLFPRRTRTALDRVEHHPGFSAAIGTLVCIAAMPVAILLAITIVGIPLILVEIAALCAMLWIGEAAVALLIGRRFYELVRPHTTPSPLAALLVGLTLITAAELLPVVGYAVCAIVSLVGIGCATMAFVEERRFVRFERPGGAGGGPSGAGGAAPSAPMRSS